MSPKTQLLAYLVTGLASFSCGGGGGGSSTPPAEASAPTVTPVLANAFVDPVSGATKGDQTGLAAIEFSLTQEPGQSSDVEIEYSTNGGALWQRASVIETLTGLGAPGTAGETEDGKVQSIHFATWNMAKDLGPGNFGAANAAAGYPSVEVRVRVAQGKPSPPAEEPVEVNLLGIPVPSAEALGAARYGHVSASLPNGNVLVIGGTGAEGPTSTGEVGWRPNGVADFDFSNAAGLAEPRTHATGTMLFDTRVVIAGGTVEGEASDMVEIYDPISGEVVEGTGLNSRRAGHVAELMPNGSVLVAGGSEPGAAGTAELYDPKLDAWTEFALPAEIGRAASARLADGRVLLVGANPDTGASRSILLALNSSGAIDGSLGPVPVAGRFGATATTMPDGRVLVVGGQDVGGSLVTPVAEVFDPVANAFEALDEDNDAVPGYALKARYDHRATRMGDGSVLITGGRGESGEYLRQTEFFLPLLDTFTPAAPLPEARADHQVDVLAGGVAVVTGGLSDGGAADEPVGSAATVLLPSGLNFPPIASNGSLDSGPGVGRATFEYTLSDVEEDDAWITIEWSRNVADPASWRSATMAESGDGRTSLSTSEAGVIHEFVWDTAADDPWFGGSGTIAVTLRLTPRGATDGAALLVTDNLTK